MNKIIDIIEHDLQKAMLDSDIDPVFGKAGLSNRPDLCEYQSNGCLVAAKSLKMNPMELAKKVCDALINNQHYESVEAVAPGFINIKLSADFLSKYESEMFDSVKYGIENIKKDTIVVDYGGANVAKPLHIGHLRSAIIGESIKRMGAYMGNDMIGDVHLGDWGLQMGLIIEQAHDDGIFPPFSISQLEEIYPKASARSKEDSAFAERAHIATLKLQSKEEPYYSIWKQILEVSKEDLKKNYDNLDVHFELWKGESDVQDLIPPLIDDLVNKNIAHESDGALVVDVKEETDSKDIPPCIVRKSDGAALYATSDLATLIQREAELNPDRYIYITDQRQSMHFLQVFRTAIKAGIIPRDRNLIHIGFGTMNGKDGKPFKTRDGGVMRLETLISDTNKAVYEKIKENRDIGDEEAEKISRIVGLAAIKYGDLSNQAAKDYVFDLDRFTSFEGNTGPYILYSIVRIKSILNKYFEARGDKLVSNMIRPADSESEKKLDLIIVRYNDVIENAWEELAPHRICQYIYSLSDAFNTFYHETKILSEEDREKKYSYLTKINLVQNILNDSIGMLGISSPERM